MSCTLDSNLLRASHGSPELPLHNKYAAIGRMLKFGTPGRNRTDKQSLTFEASRFANLRTGAL